MGVPTSEVGYTSATTGRGDHEVHKGYVVALEGKKYFFGLLLCYVLYQLLCLLGVCRGAVEHLWNTGKEKE
jgi:hypothetical protein